jgi:hypothetical protein
LVRGKEVVMGEIEKVLPSEAAEFERAAKERQPGLVVQLVAFLLENKKWWLAPILVVLALVGVLVLLGGTGVAPFIYTLF